MSTKRIAINTAATYLRFVLSAGLALFSSRWVLNGLGQTDYGIFSLVGTLIIFITALNNLMASSAARYFAYAIGQDDTSELKKWFKASIGIHIILAMLLVVIGWPIGEYIISQFLMIPADRIIVGTWIFRISLISAFVSMVTVPFVAMFTAKQEMMELAVWGVLQAACCFILAWFLMHETGDRLWFYAIGMVTISVIYNIVQIIRAFYSFSECHITAGEWFNRDKYRKLFSFAGWNLFGWSGVLFRDQGSAVLLNLFFGPSANAAYAIATQVCNQTNQFSAAIISSFSPAITATEGAGERDKMLTLSQHASKFGTILVLLLAIPIIIEMEVILNLWLSSPPPNTYIFCQLILGTFIIDRLSAGYMLAINARGRIAGYQATIGTCQILTLPLGWLLLKFNYPASSIGLAFLATITVVTLGRVLWGRYIFGISLYSWLTGVIKPCVIVAAITTTAALLTSWLFEPSFYRVTLVLAASSVASLFSIWFFALNSSEQKYTSGLVLNVFTASRLR